MSIAFLDRGTLCLSRESVSTEPRVVKQPDSSHDSSFILRADFCSKCSGDKKVLGEENTLKQRGGISQCRAHIFSTHSVSHFAETLQKLLN